MLTRRLLVTRFFIALVLAGCVSLGGPKALAQAAPEILTRDTAPPLMPASVFFAGQTATIQARNSAGIRFGDKHVMLAALVDTSGYSTGIQEKYQAYLITEVKLKIGDQTLAPGAYGFGFVGANQMVLMDLGANEILKTAATHDETLRRPTPLQILPAADSPASFRLYLGRNFVTIAEAR